MRYDNAGNLKHDTYTGAGNRTYDGDNKITSAGSESAFSYEDIESNNAGADFGDDRFDENGAAVSEQVKAYLENGLQATLPEFAPNYSALPRRPVVGTGSRSNQSGNTRNDSTSANNVRNNRRQGGQGLSPARRRP